jgi:hypothetical protein
MDDLQLILSVTSLFLLRIGLPVLLLVGLGILVDRWQSKREDDYKNYPRG